MIDRLKDLQRMALKRGLKIEEPEDYEERDEKLKEEDKMKDFSIKVATSHTFIKTILLSVDHLLQIKEQIQITVGSEKEKILSREIDDNNSLVQLNQQKMKVILEQLQESVKEAKEEDKENKNPETRIKVNLLGSLLKQYEEACTKFQNVENEIKTIMQTRVVRDAEIILARKLEPGEREQILLDPTQVQKYYEDKLTVGASIKLQNAVSDIEERHKDIQKLEKSINQVHQLFIELATLVQLQGEIIDNIVDNISTAKDYVLKAEVDIVQAKKNMQSARKKKCCILIIVIAIIIVIVAPVLGTKLSSA